MKSDKPQAPQAQYESTCRPFSIVLGNFWANFSGSSNLEQILPF